MASFTPQQMQAKFGAPPAPAPTSAPVAPSAPQSFTPQQMQARFASSNVLSSPSVQDAVNRGLLSVGDTIAQQRAARIAAGQPVANNPNRVEPTMLGNLARGFLTPAANIGKTILNIGRTMAGESNTKDPAADYAPLKSQYLGDVYGIGDEAVYREIKSLQAQGKPIPRSLAAGSTSDNPFGDVKDALGVGAQLGTFIPGEGLPASLAKTVIEEGTRALGEQVAKKGFLEAIPQLAKEGAVYGGGNAFGKSVNNNTTAADIPSVIANTVLGSAEGAATAPVAGTLLHGAGNVLSGDTAAAVDRAGGLVPSLKELPNKVRDIYNLYNPGKDATSIAATKLESNLRDLTKGVLIDNVQRENNIQRATRGAIRFARDSGDITIPNDKGEMVKFNIKTASPNEIFTAINDHMKTIAENGRAEAVDASAKGGKISQQTIGEAIQKVRDSESYSEYPEKAAQTFIKKLNDTNGDPLQIHDLIQEENGRLAKAYDKGKVPDSRDAILNSLRNGMDEVVGRKEYGQAYGDAITMTKMFLIALKKAAKADVPTKDILDMNETALDAALAVALHNPAIAARGLVGKTLGAFVDNFNNKRGLRLVKGVIKNAADSTADVASPTGVSKVIPLQLPAPTTPSVPQ